MAQLTGKTLLRSWILLSLLELGGEGSRGEVLDHIEARFGDLLSQGDLTPVTSRPHEVKWRNNASWEKANLIREGLVEAYSKRNDPWKLTEAGRVLAEELNNQGAGASTNLSVVTRTKARDTENPRPFDPSSQPKVPSQGEVSDPEAAQVLKEQAVIGHHQLLVSLTEFLATYSWSEFLEVPGGYDLRAEGPGGLGRVFFEAKTITDSNERSQVRSAIGQLLEYRLEYGEPGDFVCLVATRKLSAWRAELLEALEIAAIHEEDGVFIADNEFGDLILPVQTVQQHTHVGV